MVVKVGTMFSGIGAPEEALKMMDIETENVYACDIDPKCEETFKHNHKVKHFYKDVFDVKKHKIDLLVFGSPCQSFSFSGKRKGLEDERGRLVFQAIKVLNEQKPKYFIAENVQGILAHSKIIIEKMSKHYNVKYKVLDSNDFGLPQIRKRVWFIGIRKDIKQDFIFPEPYDKKVLLAEVLSKGLKSNKKYYATKDFLKKDKVKARFKYADGKTINCITHTIGRNGSSSEYMSYVAATYKAIGEKRKPSPEECLKLFGFSDEFKFPDSVKMTHRYNQVGNTMAVPVIKEILEKLIK